jgi:type III secretion system YscQ/HrcQ family protein
MPNALNLDRLPRVSATGVSAARRAAARLGAPESDHPILITIPPFGLVSLRYLEITPPREPEATDSIWSVARDGRQGYLIVDGLGGLHVVAATLGLPGPLALRALGAGERGVVTAAIVSVLNAVTTNVVLSLGAGRWCGDGLARLVLLVESNLFRERVVLDIPPEWIPSHAEISLPDRAVARGLQISIAVELARTTLTAHDWSRARSGDAITFDERSAVRGNADWPVQIVCGDFAADAVTLPDGHTRLITGFRPTNRSRGAEKNSDDFGKSGRGIMSSDDLGVSSLTVLAAAPIEIVAEVGRIVLRADEVAALRPGSILSLGPLRPTTVDLVVGDRVWARGELVDVEGLLGVRLTTLTEAVAPHSVSGEAETLR